MQTSSPQASRIRTRVRHALDRGIWNRHETTTTSAIRTQGSGVRARSFWTLRARLAQPSSVWAIIAASLCLCSPAAVTGLILDDNFHALALREGMSTPGTKRAAWDAFSFAPSATTIAQMIEESTFPWWSDPRARLAFFRPLTSLTLWLDHHVWPSSPALMHLHSFLWFALLLTVVGAVYRRFSSSQSGHGFAGVALMLFAFDDAHAMTVGWIANRGALMALTFGCAALLAHDSWRVSGRARSLAAALVLLALALLCAEAATQAFAYIVAYAALLDRGSRSARWRSLTPYALLLLTWRAIYEAHGFGSLHAGLYTDPAHNPLRFLTVIAARLPLLLAAQLGGLSADLGDVLKYSAPSLQPWLLPLALLIVAVCAWLILPLWRARRDVRFWVLGMALSLVPVCAAAPADRLLLGAGLGGSASIAILLLTALDQPHPVRPLGRRLAIWGCAAVHLIFSPLLLPMQAYALRYMDSYIDTAERSIPDTADVRGKTVVLLNPPTDEYGIYMAHHRRVRGGVMPAHIRWLATCDTDLLLTRIDTSALKITPKGGFLPPGAFWTLRSPDYHSHVGDRVQLQDATYFVTAVTSDGRPAELTVHFDRPLDAPSFLWMRWSERNGFVPFLLPPPGKSVLIPAVAMHSVFVDGPLDDQ